MRYSAEHKQETRAKIMGAAGRVFRSEGYGAAGIDGLTKAAGVTNGAFYGHFRSKAEAFRETMTTGMEELRAGIEQFRTQRGSRWLKPFVDFYMGHKRTCDLGESCALPSLSPEVARADPEVKAAYQAELERIVALMADGLSGETTRERGDAALVLLATLAGGSMLARAVADPKLADRIAAAVKRQALATGAIVSPTRAPG